MSDWNPGPGWRQADMTEWKTVVDGIRFDSADGPRFWIRESPVTPLPTVPFAVVEITSTTDPAYGLTAWFLTPNDEWSPVGEYAASLSAGFRPSVVTGWRVLSEPRAVTAKAVLEAFERRNWSTDVLVVEGIAREFGVEQ